jgi:hypothetical protein
MGERQVLTLTTENATLRAENERLVNEVFDALENIAPGAVDFERERIEAGRPADLAYVCGIVASVVQERESEIEGLRAERTCDCGAALTVCEDCAVADYQAGHPECAACCPPSPVAAPTVCNHCKSVITVGEAVKAWPSGWLHPMCAGSQWAAADQPTTTNRED